MKKVLVIGYLWPYHLGSGARVPGLIMHLHEFGWEPIVITKPLFAKPDLGCQIIETPYRNVLDFWLRLFRLNSNENLKEQVNRQLGITSKGSIKKTIVYFIITHLMEIIGYPDLERGWKTFALKACTELLQRGDINALISCSPPVTSHLIARELKIKHEIPWIADLPHLWSQNNCYPYSFLRRMFDRRLELKTLSKVNALTTTSEPLAAKIGTLHKEKSIYVITHGFDPDTVNTLPDKLTDKFTISYTGSFVPVLREPAMLFTALQKLISKGAMEPENIEVRFYGTEENWIDREAEKYGLVGLVKQYGRVPMEVAQAKQRESQVLFNPKWDDPQEPGIHSMKILEYLAARRPILATGKYKDVVDELLDETGAGICASSVEDVEYVLEKAYQEYKLKGKVAWRGDESKINNYSHREMARKFAEVLDSLI